MFSWATSTIAAAATQAQSAISAVAGTAEPIYGPEAFHSVALQEEHNPTYEIKAEDLSWRAPESTAVETQTWYIHCDSGHYIVLQVIYSNVANLHVTTQFNVKIFYPDGKVLWSPAQLSSHEFLSEKRNFHNELLDVSLADDDNSFTIKSMADDNVLVDLKISRNGPGFKIGKDAMTLFGTDKSNPWGSIRHIFWPRATAEGVVVAKDEKIDVTGKAMFVMALQGMKPHHAASTWDFLTFHGPNLSAVMMCFTTPPSYGSSTVNVSGIVSNDKLLLASTKGAVEHAASKPDEVSQWPEPTAVKCVWKAKSPEGKEIEASLEGPLENRLDRVDILAEVPTIIKNLVGGVVGTRPYIYQFREKATLKLKDGDDVKEEEGYVFYEATFIS